MVTNLLVMIAANVVLDKHAILSDCVPRFVLPIPTVKIQTCGVISQLHPTLADKEVVSTNLTALDHPSAWGSVINHGHYTIAQTSPGPALLTTTALLVKNA